MSLRQIKTARIYIYPKNIHLQVSRPHRPFHTQHFLRPGSNYPASLTPLSCITQSHRLQQRHNEALLLRRLADKRNLRTSSTMASATSFYDFKPLDKKGEPFPLSEVKGKVVLVVNTASKCGFTPQFEGLEKLYQELKAKHGNKFTILGFPCNQFGSQDPGTNDEIQSFCQINYGVTFPVLGKVDVNGGKADPVWEWMKKSQPGLMGFKVVKWNFEKFLIGADGKVKGRWASTTKPEQLKETIEKELATVEKPVA